MLSRMNPTKTRCPAGVVLSAVAVTGCATRSGLRPEGKDENLHEHELMQPQPLPPQALSPPNAPSGTPTPDCGWVGSYERVPGAARRCVQSVSPTGILEPDGDRHVGASG